MSVNNYSPHLVVLPEDKANSDIANAFLLHPQIDLRSTQVLPYIGGWGAVVKHFTDKHISKMRQYSERRIVLLIDFDEEQNRCDYVKREIPEDLIDRVFVLGVFSEPEELRNITRQSYEKIGKSLANDCAENTDKLWKHDLLKHNEAELKRIISSIKPFLFNES